MEKEFIAYKLAVKLKALGFDAPCFKYVYIGDTGNNFDHYLEVEPSKAKNYNEDDLCISQPTFSQAFRWFREKHQIFPEVLTDCTTEPKFVYTYNRFYGNPKDLTEQEWGWENNISKYSEIYRTYEEAELACLERLIEKITNKKIFDFVTDL